jgi:hypothetical protein
MSAETDKTLQSRIEKRQKKADETGVQPVWRGRGDTGTSCGRKLPKKQLQEKNSGP